MVWFHGGGKVLSLLHSPLASGLFHKAIVQSGMDDPRVDPLRFPVRRPLAVQEAFEAGKHNDVPIMAGANTGDFSDLKTGLQWYMPWVAENNKSDVPAYHGIELVYTFDYPGSFANHYMFGLTEHLDPAPEKFARTGDPSIHASEGTSAITWMPYDSQAGNFFRICTMPGMEDGLINAFE